MQKNRGFREQKRSAVRTERGDSNPALAFTKRPVLDKLKVKDVDEEGDSRSVIADNQPDECDWLGCLAGCLLRLTFELGKGETKLSFPVV